MDTLDPLMTSAKRDTTLYVHVLAMAHGDTILIMAPDGAGEEITYKNILIDLGEAEIIEIEEYLNHFHATHLDALIITHPHDDHASQIDQFYERMTTRYSAARYQKQYGAPLPWKSLGRDNSGQNPVKHLPVPRSGLYGGLLAIAQR